MTSNLPARVEPPNSEGDESRNRDFYHNLRKRIRVYFASSEGKQNKWLELLLFAPDLFHVLVKLTGDSRVPAAEKAKLVAAFIYSV